MIHTIAEVVLNGVDNSHSAGGRASRAGQRHDPVAAHDAIMQGLAFEGSDEEHAAGRRPASSQMFDWEDAEDEPDPPAPAAPAPPAPQPGQGCAVRAAPPRGLRPDNSMTILGHSFVMLKEGTERRWTGISRMCRTCGYERNLYHKAAGIADNTAAQRLLNWENKCPGRHESRAHKALGQPRVAGRLMVRYD